MKPEPGVEDAVKPAQGGTEPEDEWVAEDDAVIGPAFRWSLLVIVSAAVLVAIGVYMFRPSDESAPEQAIEAVAPEPVFRAEAPKIPFTDITASSGITFRRTNGAYGDKLLPETMGGGVAFLDYDNDGDPDLLFVNSTFWPHRREGGPEPTMALYANDGDGSFRDVTRETGLSVSFYGMGAAVADYDGDGWTDIYLTGLGENRLLRNTGATFEDATDRAGVAGTPDAWSSSAGFFDYDGDGDLDLFVANYVRWSKEIDFELDFRLTGVGRAYGPPQDYEGSFPYLFRNEGDGTFTDVSEQSGVQVRNPATGLPAAKSLALGIVDVDGDGAMDVLVANDTVANYLFRNRGDGTFEDVAEFYGLAYGSNGKATGAMGVDAGHIRNDHNLGFVIGNFANEMTSVYVSQDDRTFFVDDAIGAGIGAPSRLALTFGALLLDVDLDGRLDLLQANGHIETEISKMDPSQSYKQAAQLFWNTDSGGSTFIMVPEDAVGDLAQKIVGRGAAYADVDGDGDLDVVLTQVGDRPLLLRNDQTLGNHWLRVRLEGRPPNRDGIGAWVEAEVGGVVQRRQVMPTRSYLSQVELEVTFGLGRAGQLDRLVVTWPDDERQVVAVPGVDRLLTVAR